MRFHEIVPIFNLLVGRRLDAAVFGLGRDVPEQASVPRTFLLHGEELTHIRQRWMSRDEPIASAVNEFLRHADEILPLPARSVREKAEPSWGDSVADYVSLARYWWPNAETPDGLPFVVRDGEVNPEVYSESYDLNRLEQFSYHAFVLAFAYAVSGDERFARRCAELIEHWCLAPDSCQSPHFEFAQVRPGRKRKVGVGTVEAHRLIYVVEAAQMIAESPHWPDERATALKGWFSSLLTWLRTSRVGLDAGMRANNIGVWYDVQCATYALYVGDKQLAATIVQDSAIRRLDTQLGAAGSFPAELVRARPYDYFAFNLLAYMALARVGESVDVDLWTRALPDGRNLEAAVQWLRNVVQPETLSFDLALRAAQVNCGSAVQSDAAATYDLLHALRDEADSLRWKVRSAAAERGELVARVREQERRVERLRSLLKSMANGRAEDELSVGTGQVKDHPEANDGENMEHRRLSEGLLGEDDVKAMFLELEQLHREKAEAEREKLSAAATVAQLQRRLREQGAASRVAERFKDEALAAQATAQREKEHLDDQLQKAARKIVGLEEGIARLLRARSEGEGRLRDRYEYLLQDQAANAEKKLAAEKARRREVARDREQARVQLESVLREQAKEKRRRHVSEAREQRALDALGDAMRMQERLAVRAARLNASLARLRRPVIARLKGRLFGSRLDELGETEAKVIEGSGILALARQLQEAGADADTSSGVSGRLDNVLPVFCEGWYIARYPDVLLRWNNPLAEYLAEGWQAGRRPHPLFWGKWYAQRYLAEQPNVCPLVHFLERAAEEELDPNPFFDSSWYRRKHLSGADDQTVPLLHYIAKGRALRLETSPRVDLKLVREHCARARISGADPLAVFLDLPREERLAFMKTKRKGKGGAVA